MNFSWQRDRNKRPAVPGTTQHWPLPHIVSVHSNTHSLKVYRTEFNKPCSIWQISYKILNFSIKMEDVYLNEKRTCCKPDSNLGNLHKHKSNHSNMLIWETFHIIINVTHTFLPFQTSGFPHFVCKQNFESGVNLIWSLMDRRHAKH